MSSATLFGIALDAMWQGILVCSAVAIGLRFTRRSSAATRSAIWSGALASCLTVALLGVAVRHTPTVAAATPRVVRGAAGAAEPHGPTVPRLMEFNENMRGAPAISPVKHIAAIVERAADPVVIIGLLVAAIRCGVFSFQVLATLRLRRTVTRIEAPLADLPVLQRRYAFGSSADAATPHVLGFGLPLVVLPSALLDHPGQHLRSVVLHELAHVRRYDDVRGALEELIAAVVWWDPGVRFALGCIARLRERICDDAVVEATHDRLGYAKVLAEIARGVAATPASVPCFSQRNTALERIRAILDASVDRAPRPDRRLIAGALMVSAILVTAMARFHVPVSADPATLPPSTSQADGQEMTEMHYHARGTSVAPAVFRGTWTLAHCANAGMLRLGIAFAAESPKGYERWNVAACVPESEFRVMSATTLASAAGAASFSVVRSAGTFDATGQFNNGIGAGTYTFAPSAAFLARVRAFGNGTLTDDQLFALTIADFQDVELDALSAHGFPKPTPDELVRLAYIDANSRFVLAAVQLPAATKTVSRLLMLGERGVRADDIAAIESYGYRPTLDQFIRLAEVGVRAPFIARLRAGGYTDTNVDHLIALREEGG
jgi:beta-lactamase regulating signal transducer with metallopeptidase domain